MSFTQWRSVAGNKRRLRLTQAQVAKRWANMEIYTAFNTWKGVWLVRRSPAHCICRHICP